MSTISALRFFSIDHKRLKMPIYSRIAASIITLWMSAFYSFACGPYGSERDRAYYGEREALNTTFLFDPAIDSAHLHSDYFFDQFIINELTNDQTYNRWQASNPQTNYLDIINTLLKEQGRKIIATDDNNSLPTGNTDTAGNTIIRLRSLEHPEYNEGDAVIFFMLAIIRDKSLSDTNVIQLMEKRDLLGVILKSEMKDYISKNFSEPTNEYDYYLLAAANFYMEDYATAKSMFTTIANNKSSPFAEASLYVLARIELINTDYKMDYVYEANDEKELNKRKQIYQQASISSGERALTAYNEYLKQYPNGNYAKSAQGMLLHCNWRAGKKEQYINILKQDGTALLQQSLTTPEWTPEELANFEDLMESYRYAVEYDQTKMWEDKTETINKQLTDLSPLEIVFPKSLQASIQKGTTEKHKSIARLYEYRDLLAKFKEGNYSATISYYTNKDNLKAPEQLLYLRALEKNKEYEKAIAYLDKLRKNNINEELDSNADIEIAHLIVANTGIKDLFTNSLITKDGIKLYYLATLCDEKQQLGWLKNPAISDTNKHTILADISTRYLYQERIKELHSLYEQYANMVLQEFSEIRTAIKNAAKGKNLGKAYTDIGDFMQTTLTPFFEINAEKNSQLCQRTVVEDGAAGPYYYFNLAALNFEKSNDPAEAKLLSLLTHCGKSGRSSVRCKWGYQAPQGGNKIMIPEYFDNAEISGINSKQAFTKLHKKYKGSKWAEETPYHY